MICVAAILLPFLLVSQAPPGFLLLMKVFFLFDRIWNCQGVAAQDIARQGNVGQDVIGQDSYD